MRWLWLVPALGTMGVAILFLLSSAQRGTGMTGLERTAYLLLGLCLQASSLAAAAQVGTA